LSATKTVLITGASSGFGRGFVSELLGRGWTVVAALRDAEKRRSLFSDELKQYGDRLQLVDLDVTSDADRKRAHAWIDAKLDGKLDCLINNAGYGITGALEDLSEEQIRYQFEVNFFGVALLTKELLPCLRAAKGRVIQLSSVAGFSSLPLNSMYCATKHAIEGLTETMQYEVLPLGVQVCLVEPGGFATPFKASRVLGEHSLDSASPYFDFTRRFEKLLTNPPKFAFGDPQVVIRKVGRLADRRRLPLRVRCGKDSNLAFIVRSLLPGEWGPRVLRWSFQSIISRIK
jgi:NAD(P)-dependent dehydrogenase (short-subunit alcohol dehydrogenase family)